METQSCRPSELAEFRLYQATLSNTRTMVLALLDSGVPLTKGAVTGQAEIGELQTFFKNVGAAVALKRHNTDRFRLYQVLQLFEESSLANDQDILEMRDSVFRYAELFLTPASAPRVTVLDCADATTLVDGNKTAMAAWVHSGRRSFEQYSLPVYCLRVPHLTIKQLLG